MVGDEHVDRAVAATSDVDADFQRYITTSAWGALWSRDDRLDRRTRSCVTIAVLTALRAEHELPLHIRAGRRNGLSDDEIKEILLQCAIYCGVPAANSAFAIARRTLEEE